MHFAGELLVAREICLGCSDTGLVFGPYGLGYSLNLYLHLCDLKTMSVSCELTRRQSRCIPFRLLHLVPSPLGAGPPFSALKGGQVRSERGGQSQANLHAGRSHRLLAFVGCSEGFVEILVHTSRKAKRGMSPSCTTLSSGNAADKSRARECVPDSFDHVLLSEYVALWGIATNFMLGTQCPYQLVFRRPPPNIKSFRLTYLMR
jgi:hypothetical protein